MRKETNTPLSRGLRHPGHTGRSDPGLDHPREQGPGLDHLGLPWRSKGRAEGDQHRLEPWIGASGAHGEKRPRIGSSKEAGPRTGSSRAAKEKQRLCERRPTPPRAVDWSIQGTWGEATQDWIIQGSRAQDWIIQGCHGEAKAVRKETNTALSPRLEHPGHTGRSDRGLDRPGEHGPGLDHLGLPWRSKGRGEGDQHRPEHRIGASRAHAEQLPRIGLQQKQGPV